MKDLSVDDAAEILEPLLDATSRNELKQIIGEDAEKMLLDLPLIKYGVITHKVFSSARTTVRRRKMIAFLKALGSGEKSISEYEELSDGDKELLRGIVITQLDSQTDERQAEATGYLTDAYLQRKIDRLTYLGVLSEIKNTNPLLYYFSVDGYEIEGDEEGVQKVKGPTELLPVAFGHNAFSTSRGWSDTGESYFVLSRLGKAFFKHVYWPMSEKYQI